MQGAAQASGLPLEWSCSESVSELSSELSASHMDLLVSGWDSIVRSKSAPLSRVSFAAGRSGWPAEREGSFNE